MTEELYPREECPEIMDEVEVEELAIDGICGVY
jgi:mycofactocin precursor